jgi:predicted phosphodiesterase
MDHWNPDFIVDLSMRLLVLSDLHHELWRERAPQIDPAVNNPDVVILAGDINTGAKAVDWAACTFPGLPVMYVHGNHEG